MEIRCQDYSLGFGVYHRYIGKPRYLYDLYVPHNIILKDKNYNICGKSATLDSNNKTYGAPETRLAGTRWWSSVNFHRVFRNTNFSVDYSESNKNKANKALESLKAHL